ncbi:MAG: hypothetical protein GF317_03820 [Candidatus Lokiarchaeota archaeon]|nr:hypothetical protein [Candidatus Lokiarchaeota archaeon]MBD3199014.1 hypothetical protein [Candidatus Lokiarchaeota archaeon]
MKRNEVLGKDNKFETINFKDIDKLIFPKVCLKCGKNTESTYQKMLYGKFIPEKSFRNNYLISLPICLECKDNLKIKTGFQNKWIKSLLLFSIVGIIFMMIILLNTYSILMGISILIITILIPIILYQRSIKNKVRLDQFFRMNLVEGKQDIIEITLLNNNYVNFLKKVNSK